MMKIKNKLLLFTVIPLMCSCVTITTHYNEHLNVVKSVAAPGRNIYSVKIDLEKKGYDVSDPYDPTKLGKVLWMNVRWGASPGVIDGMLYASGLPDKGQPNSIIVKSDRRGKVIGVK